MQKYKSEFIKDNDLRVFTSRKFIDDERIEVVRIKHYPTKKEVTVENKSQIKAYNIALKELEEILKE